MRFIFIILLPVKAAWSHDDDDDDDDDDDLFFGLKGQLIIEFLSCAGGGRLVILELWRWLSENCSGGTLRFILQTGEAGEEALDATATLLLFSCVVLGFVAFYDLFSVHFLS